MAGIVWFHLAKVLRNMKVFRNVLVHEYGDVIDDFVFLFLTTRRGGFTTFRQGIVEALAATVEGRRKDVPS
jgi:uncharacterized protein YutE (UPF0331/DUF86 family)